jgi:hypothetical protein
MARTESENKVAARISLPLSEDGLSVDWTHVRQSTAAKFEALLRTDPNIRKAYEEENGVVDGGQTDPFGGVTQENVHALLDTIGKANGLLFQMVCGKFIKHPLLKNAKTGQPVKFLIDPDIASNMGFSAKQHEELDPRATKIAQKYSNKLPSWLRENFDLYMFGYMFVAYTAENAKLVLTMQLNRDIKQAQYNYAQAVANQPKNPKPDSDAVPTNGTDKNPPNEFSGFHSVHSPATDGTPGSEAPTV